MMNKKRGLTVVVNLPYLAFGFLQVQYDKKKFYHKRSTFFVSAFSPLGDPNDTAD